jgi:natural product precursor
MKEKLKLNKLSMTELESKEMNSLRGGLSSASVSTLGGVVAYSSPYSTTTTTRRPGGGGGGGGY